MNGADLAILAIGLISMLVSLFRGFVREAFSLLTWIAAGYLALRASGPLALEMTPWIEMPSARIIIAFVGIFIAVLVVGALCNFLLGKLVSSTGLSGTDRLLGAIFGLLRGLAIVLAVVIVARFTPFPDDPWWQTSELLPHFERTAVWAVEQFPESLQSQIPDSMPAGDDAPVQAEVPEQTRADR